MVFMYLFLIFFFKFVKTNFHKRLISEFVYIINLEIISFENCILFRAYFVIAKMTIKLLFFAMY